MCGIHLHISKSAHVDLESREAEFLSRRGPDALCAHKIVISKDAHQYFLTFTSSVLSLRGNSVQAQPVVDEGTGSIFCWNGEAWLIDNACVSGNDTQTLSHILFNKIRCPTSTRHSVLDALNTVSGPYAFILYDAISKTIYLGRDPLGRRSLLLDDSRIDEGELTVSSIITSAHSGTTREVDANSFIAIDLTREKLILSRAGSRPLLPAINRQILSSAAVTPALPTNEVVSASISELKKSLEVRIKDIPTYTTYGPHTCPSRVAVLFSGGLDCALLARLAHEILPYDQPVDLLNVAFENPRVINARVTKNYGSVDTTSTINSYEICPDRITGRSSFGELRSICHQRVWRFVAIDIPFQEYTEHRSTIVRLMQPHKTEMDLSIASALYFAARGRGTAILSTSMQEQNQYNTTARVLLSGLGADELFGGYARHAAAFSRGGYLALIEELEIDFNRIGTRNLGRDDRVIAHWGRETRYPFLDERFVNFALSLPVWEKCGFRQGKPVPKHFEATVLAKQMEELHPEKMLLRCTMWQLGMVGAASEKKRAIQFGARTAKMHAGSSKGTDLVVMDPFS